MHLEVVLSTSTGFIARFKPCCALVLPSQAAYLAVLIQCLGVGEALWSSNSESFSECPPRSYHLSVLLHQWPVYPAASLLRPNEGGRQVRFIQGAQAYASCWSLLEQCTRNDDQNLWAALRVHFVFHVSILEPVKQSFLANRQAILPQPALHNNKLEYQVEAIKR